MRALSAAKSATTTVVLCGRNQKQIKPKAILRSKGWAVRQTWRIFDCRTPLLDRVCLRSVPVGAFAVG